MSFLQIPSSELFVDLSEKQEELVAGGVSSGPQNPLSQPGNIQTTAPGFSQPGNPQTTAPSSSQLPDAQQSAEAPDFGNTIAMAIFNKLTSSGLLPPDFNA